MQQVLLFLVALATLLTFLLLTLSGFNANILETIEAFNSEHLNKITIGGVPAEEGVNYTIESDGAEGCVITTISDEALKITNIVNDEDEDYRMERQAGKFLCGRCFL